MIYNFILERFVLPFGDFLLGTNFIAELKRLRNVQWEDSESHQARQRTLLNNLLIHASTHVPYYRDLAISNDQDAIAWLKKFPLLKKEDIKLHVNRMIWEELKSENLVKESSSGSSGVQSTVYLSKREVSQTQALQTLLWEWSGYTLGAALLQLGMTLNRSVTKNLKDFFLRVDYQQAFNISKSEAEQVLNKVSGDNSFFGGYASGLYSYAILAEKLPARPTFRSVISWGDKMFPHYRSKIESVFNSRVFDTYGSTEGFVIAGQCSEGSYHVLAPHVYLELLDNEGNEVGPGEPGFVVVTRLDGFSMPLIRYYLGDIAIREADNFRCSCGRQLPVLRQIIGRDSDIVRTSSGKFLIVHFFTGIFEHVSQIRQFRVVQKELDRIIVEYIPEMDCSETVLNTVRDTIQKKLGEKIVVDFNQVENIPATPSGKPQIIKSELPVRL